MTIRKKLVRNFFIQNFLGLIAALYIYITKITSSIKYENQLIPEGYWKNNQPFILAFWHNQLMTISYGWKTNKKISILASSHSDGRFGALVGKYYNLDIENELAYGLCRRCGKESRLTHDGLNWLNWLYECNTR